MDISHTVIDDGQSRVESNPPYQIVTITNRNLNAISPTPP